jgi:hypothetical protein
MLLVPYLDACLAAARAVMPDASDGAADPTGLPSAVPPLDTALDAFYAATASFVALEAVAQTFPRTMFVPRVNRARVAAHFSAAGPPEAHYLADLTRAQWWLTVYTMMRHNLMAIQSTLVLNGALRMLVEELNRAPPSAAKRGASEGAAFAASCRALSRAFARAVALQFARSNEEIVRKTMVQSGLLRALIKRP